MGTGSPPAERNWFWEMLAAATAAARIMVPNNKRSDFFIIVSPHQIRSDNVHLIGARYLKRQYQPRSRFSNRFSVNNGLHKSEDHGLPEAQPAQISLTISFWDTPEGGVGRAHHRTFSKPRQTL